MDTDDIRELIRFIDVVLTQCSLSLGLFVCAAAAMVSNSPKDWLIRAAVLLVALTGRYVAAKI